MNMDQAPHTRWGITISLLGIGATFAAACLTWYASHLSTKQAAAESCIARVDKQEQLIREKAEDLLSNITLFAVETGAPGTTEKQFRDSGGRLIDSAMRFSAYAPNELAGASFKLAGIVQVGLMAETTEQKIQALNLASGALSGWPSAYYGLMDSYAKLRSECLD